MIFKESTTWQISCSWPADGRQLPPVDVARFCGGGGHRVRAAPPPPEAARAVAKKLASGHYCSDPDQGYWSVPLPLPGPGPGSGCQTAPRAFAAPVMKLTPALATLSGSGAGLFIPGHFLSFLSQDLAGRPNLWSSVSVLSIHRAPRGAGRGGQSPCPLLPLPAGTHRDEEDPPNAHLSDRHTVGQRKTRASMVPFNSQNQVQMPWQQTHLPSKPPKCIMKSSVLKRYFLRFWNHSKWIWEKMWIFFEPTQAQLFWKFSNSKTASRSIWRFNISRYATPGERSLIHHWAPLASESQFTF